MVPRIFMRNFFVGFALAFTLLLSAGCKEDEPEYGAPMSVQIYGVSGLPDLYSGVKVGLFVDDPVKADNIPASARANGVAMPDKDIRWGFDQNRSSRFLAYSPYDASYTGQDFVQFNVPADQSSAEKMYYANLLLGVASGSPQDNPVRIKLEHAMTAMAVSVDNRTGLEIRSFKASGFMTSGILDFVSGTIRANGDKEIITPLKSPAGDSYTFLYIPQDVTPLFEITLASGKTMAFTYDLYCHEYPGQIIKMSLQIDEDTPEANILQLSGVSLAQWATTAVPVYGVEAEYTNLAGLKDVEYDKTGFFAAYLNKVTVTAVDRTNPNGLGVILEDSSRAIHVWAHDEEKLEVGNTIAGPALGYMNRTSEGEIFISHFFTAYSTVGKTKVLPLTPGKFSAVADSLGNWEYRRMEFKDVTLKEAFSHGRARFIQDGTEMTVICQGMTDILSPGVRGDLVGFPMRSGSEIIIRVYDTGAFSSFVRENTENAFTRVKMPGFYDLSQPDTAVYELKGADIQYSVSHNDSDGYSLFQTYDFENDVADVAYSTGILRNPLPGQRYQMSINPGRAVSHYESGLKTMECIRVEDDRAWLMDSADPTVGLIVALW